MFQYVLKFHLGTLSSGKQVIYEVTLSTCWTPTGDAVIGGLTEEWAGPKHL